ncbi:MAG TPA: hypothetical protein PK447_10570 [Ignavibacteria bacterium]|nr:hypothetical protein [Ignavibacteria bacterium]
MKTFIGLAVLLVLLTSTSLFSQTKKHFSDFTAGMQNTELSQQALDAVNKKAENEKWKERYSQAVITSDDWKTEYNEITGNIICRKLYMVLYGTWPDGRCKAVQFGFRQDYTGGGSYSPTLQYNSIGDMEDIECE